MEFIISLIKKIENIFLSIFFSAKEDYKKKKQMRMIDSSVRQIKPVIYKGNNIILPGFAVILFKMYKSALPLKKLLDNTICSKDLRLSSKYIQEFMESAFSPEQEAAKKELSFAARRQSLEFCTKQEFDIKMQEQRRNFNSFLKTLETQKMLTANELGTLLMIFFDFLSFNFNKTFTAFDTAFEPYIGRDEIMEAYNFQSIIANSVLQDILDLNFLLRRISIDEKLVKAFLFLNQSLDENSRLPDEKIAAYIKELSFVINKTLGKNTLSNLIKIIKNDPWFEEELPAVTVKPVFEEYKENISDSFQTDTKKLEKLRKNIEMTKLISSTFENSCLLSFVGYNEEMNVRIQTLSTFSFDWITPLEVLKTFSSIYFQKSIRPFLREVIVEGYFEDKDFQNALGVSYYYCENLLSKFFDFERLFDAKSPYGINVINGYLTELERGGDFKKQLARIIDYINDAAKVIVEDAGHHYIEMFNYCEELLNDVEKSSPAHVTNIKALSVSLKNKDNFAEFEKNIKKFANFIEIIKNYVILDKIKSDSGKSDKE